MIISVLTLVLPVPKSHQRDPICSDEFHAQSELHHSYRTLNLGNSLLFKQIVGKPVLDLREYVYLIL